MTSVTFQKLSASDQTYYAETQAKCLFCDEALVQSSPKTSTSKLADLFKMVNIFVFESATTPYGHEKPINTVENIVETPRLIDCYHKGCLEKTGAYSSVTRINTLCNSCTRDIANIGEFLKPVSKQEMAFNTVKLVLKIENTQFDLWVDKLHLSKWFGSKRENIGTWISKSALFSIGTASLIGAVNGAIAKTTIDSMNMVQDDETPFQDRITSTLSSAATGAVIGGANAVLAIITARITSIAAAPTVTYLVDEKVGVMAAYGAASVRSPLGAAGIAFGSSFAALGDDYTQGIRTGFLVASSVVGMSGLFRKIFAMPNDELVREITGKQSIKSAEFDANMYNFIMGENIEHFGALHQSDADITSDESDIDDTEDESTGYSTSRRNTISENWTGGLEELRIAHSKNKGADFYE